jgi:3,4-dihydroxy 2-butanone 4-phosphate synthase
MEPHVEAAVNAFRAGEPVCLFDAENREGETDLLFPGQCAQAATMRQLRFDCGGLLFLAIGHEVGERFSLPYLQDLHMDERLMNDYPVLRELQTDDLQYDTRSAFTLSINHRDTFTGITDRDRALTTRRFAELYSELSDDDNALEKLGKEFRTPGHIPMCRESEGGLTRRQGHTELAVGLARLAGMTPVVIGAEMLQPDGDLALPVDDARIWANERGIPFLTGKELMGALGL